MNLIATIKSGLRKLLDLLAYPFMIFWGCVMLYSIYWGLRVCYWALFRLPYVWCEIKHTLSVTWQAMPIFLWIALWLLSWGFALAIVEEMQKNGKLWKFSATVYNWFFAIGLPIGWVVIIFEIFGLWHGIDIQSWCI
jgi:hypothetical protein